VRQDGQHYRGQSPYAEHRRDMSPAVAAALGLEPGREPTPAELDRLLEGRRADTGQSWPGAEREVVALDLTLSAPKALSVLVGLSRTPAEREALLLCHQRANDDAMRHAAGVMGHARRGKAGRGGAQPGAVTWTTFLHHTARPTVEVRGPAECDLREYLEQGRVLGDPQLHSHNALYNIVVTSDAHAGSLDTGALHRRVHEIGAYYHARLGVYLRQVGVQLGPPDPRTGAVTIAAVPRSVCEAFSRRTRDATADARAYAAAHGFDWDRLDAEAQVALLKAGARVTRQGRADDMGDTEAWRAQAVELGWSVPPVLGRVQYEEPSRSECLRRAAATAAESVGRALEHDAVLAEDTLRLHAARALVVHGCGGPEDIGTVADMVRDGAVPLHGAPTRLVEVTQDNQTTFVAAAQLQLEAELVAAGRAAAADRTGALTRSAIDAAVARSGLDLTSDHGRAQRDAMYKLGQGGRLSVLVGVAGAGKTTLMKPLVDAWHRDGRRVIGLGLAWRQANALGEVGADETLAVAAFLARVRQGSVRVDEQTVLVVDELGQVGPRQMAAILRIQRETGCTLKCLGDPEQCQAVEAGSTIQLLRDVLGPGDMPELLSSVRQATERGRRIAALFREGRAAEALALKREGGDALLVPGGYESVVRRAAELFVERRDTLRREGMRGHGVTASAPTNEDAAAISAAIRHLLQAAGEIGPDLYAVAAQDGDGARQYELRLAVGDRLRLYRQTPARIPGSKRGGTIGSNGSVVTVTGLSDAGLTLVNERGTEGFVAWEMLRERRSGRLLLGPGWCLTIDSAQGITAGEHLNVLPRGSAAAGGAFKAYVAESRHVARVTTLVSEAAEREAIERRRPLGGASMPPIGEEEIWASVARNLARKPYKSPALALLSASERARLVASAQLCLADRHVQEAELIRSSPAAAIVATRLGRGLSAATFGLEARAAAVAEITEVATSLGEVLEQVRKAIAAPLAMAAAALRLRRARLPQSSARSLGRRATLRRSVRSGR
jgi:hypothetical protein